MHLLTQVAVLALAQYATAQLVGYASLNGGTTGGAGGATTTVSSAAAFKTAIAKGSTVVYLNTPISYTGQYSVASKTSIIGVGTNGQISGGGLKVQDAKNVIIRNLKISKVVGSDSISLIRSSNIWVDHNELSSDLTHGVDYYDGLLDPTHACDWVTVSWNYFHDHYKASLVGASCDNQAEDGGKFHITYANNRWANLHTRTPALRFTSAHIYNNYFDSVINQGIHSRCKAQVLVEGNVFANTSEPLSTYGLVIPADSPNTSPNGDPEENGFANLGSANDWGSGKINLTATGTLTSVPYSYTLTALSSVKSVVVAGAGTGKI